MRAMKRYMWTGPAAVAIGLALLAIHGAGWQAQLAAQDPPISLGEAVDRALAESPELRDARLGVDVADEQVTAARGRLLPRLDLSFRYARNVSPPAAFFPAAILDPDAPGDELTRIQFEADNVWSSALTAEQPLLDGRAYTGLRAAQRRAQVQDEVSRGRAHDVVTEVRGLYYDVLLAQEQQELAERSRERIEASLEEVRALEAEGLASEYDVLRLEVELANVEPTIRQARDARMAGVRELGVIMGVEEAEELQVAGALAELDLDDLDANTPENRAILDFMGVAPDELDVEELERTARDERSELRQLQGEAELRRAELRTERAGYLPRVSLFGAYDIQAQQDGSPDFFGQSGQRGYGRVVGIQVSVPIFAGLQRSAQVDRVRTELQRTETRRDALAERTATGVRSQADRAEEARDRVGAQARAVEQARRAHDIARAEMAEGLASRLELTDAEVALRQAEVNYAEAVHDYLNARADLDRLTGQVPGTGGW